jgi:hypothetical protein
MPSHAADPAPILELALLYAAVTVLADALRLLLAAETEATEPAHRDLRIAR